MENYAVLVNHQCFVRFLRTTGFVEFEAISRNGISSLLVIGTHKEVENVLFRRQENAERVGQD